ncbi:hypothetical protein FOZ63_022286, partial [Perkinsus olseni]
NKEDRSPEQDFYSPESLLREGKEAGHRQAALRLRSYEDSFRNSIGTMVQREADSLVDDALAEGLGECAKRRALQEARATARFVNPVLNAMEEEQHGQDAVGSCYGRMWSDDELKQAWPFIRGGSLMQLRGL